MKPGDVSTVIGAEDIRLQLVGIDLIGKQKGTPKEGGGDEGQRGLDVLMLQHPNGQRGLLGVLHFAGSENDSDKDRGFVTLDWLLLARNVAVDPTILNHLLTDGRSSGKPAASEISLIVKRSKGANSNKHNLQRKQAWVVEEVAASLTGANDWLFGISFGLGALLDTCKLILHDEHYYGVSIEGDNPRPLIDGDRLTLAYIPGPSAKQDRFLLEVPLAFLNIMANLEAGWATISWALNTDTLIGLGFPFRHGARYRWDRSFALYVPPFMGRAGICLEKRTESRGDNQLITIGGGMGVAFGFGFAAGSRSVGQESSTLQ